MTSKLEGRNRRKLRIRKTVNGTAARPRLTVFRSAKHIYAQVIDDDCGMTVASASTLSAEVKVPDGADASKRKKADAAKAVGALVAQRCKERSIEQVVFDRNGYRYHGRIKALADGARAAGLKF
jgi:large subunit ribosomal protein L18